MTTAAVLLATAGAAAAGQLRSAGGHLGKAPMTRVHKIKIGGGPWQMAIDGRRRAVWVAGGGPGLVRISEATQKVTARLKFPASLVAVDPKTGTLWAADTARYVLVEISEKTKRIIHRFTSLPGIGLEGLTTDSRTGRVWVTTFTTLDEISEARHRVVRVISLHVGNNDDAAWVAVDPVRNMLWVDVLPGGPQASEGWISQINGSTGRIIRNYKFSEDVYGDCCVVLAVDSRRGQVWAGANGDASIISEARHRVVRVVSITPNDFWSAITIDPRHKIVLIGDGDKLLTVSEASGKILRKVRLSTSGLADALSDVRVELGTRTIYVSLLWDGAVAVLTE